SDSLRSCRPQVRILSGAPDVNPPPLARQTMKSTPETLSPMFDRAAARYDWLNTLMSLGQDAAWRRALVEQIQPGERVLDLCCGSARSSVAAAKRSGRLVVGVDVSGEMLRRGVAFASSQGARFAALCADAFRLPFADGTFDVITIAWGLRNLVPN